MSYTVTQNTSLLTGASIVQKIISFVYFTIIARLVGVENTGQYFFAITFTTVFTVVADFGLAPVLTREVAKNPERSEQYANTTLWAKIIFGIVTYGAVVLAVNFLGYDVSLKHLIYVSGITMFFDNLHSAFYSVFRGRNNLLYEAIGNVGSQIITLVIGTIALLNHWPLVWLILAYAIPSVLNSGYAAAMLKRVYGIRYAFGGNSASGRWLVRLAVPFAIAGLIGRLYSYSDSLIMSKVLCQPSTPCPELGWWGVAYKLTFAFQFIPAALAASLYPAMSGVFVSAPERLGELFAKAWRYLLLIVAPISLGILAIAEPVILYVYKPSYLPALPALQILLPSMIASFLAMVNGSLLNAINRQNIQTSLLGAMLVLSFISNLLLLPRLGIAGAAWTSLMANLLLCLLGYLCIRRFVSLPERKIFLNLNQILWPAIIMAVAVYYLAQSIHFLLAIPLGVLVYISLLFLTGGLSRKIIKEEFFEKIL